MSNAPPLDAVWVEAYSWRRKGIFWWVLYEILYDDTVIAYASTRKEAREQVARLNAAYNLGRISHSLDIQFPVRYQPS